MVIEKVHGLQSTSLSLNDRFTMLSSAAPVRVPVRQRRRPSVGAFFGQNLNFKNRMIEQIARRLEQRAKRQAVRQRLGIAGGLRRFGSESNLPGLRRSNSFGNLSQAQSIKSRVSWRQSNGNLSRSASFNNLSAGAWRGIRRRGGAQRALRGRLRGGRKAVSWLTPRPQRARSVPRGRGRGRARGGGGILRNQEPKPVPTREELDAQLDQYMACTKSALDKELDTYMKNAMDLE